MSFKKYELSENKLIQIARLCVQEQGCIPGVRAEASQAANLLETNATYRKKYGSDIYSFMRNSGWYYKAAYYMDNGSASGVAIQAVREVLCEGDRVFPQYVDEHDCISDIDYIKVNGEKVSKTDKSNYKQGLTIIKNKMGSIYTFWSFPAPGCDPFGYTQEAYDYVKKHGGGGEPVPDPDPDPQDDRVTVTVKLPELYEGCPESDAVRIWRVLIGQNPKYKTFGEKLRKLTQQWQGDHGLAADGIVGKKTWTKALNSIQ